MKLLNMTHYIIFLFSFSFQIFSFHASSDHPGFAAGSRVAIPIPPTYEDGFRGWAFFLEGGVKQPDFRAALNLEAVDGRYECSLKVVIGDTVVWASDHFLKFLPYGTCVVELSRDGDLTVGDLTGRVGWRTGTSGQGVEKLQLLNQTGNLVLLDEERRVRWQSFDHPTDVMLWGQRLDATRLTSSIANSAAFYTFEVDMGVLRLYLNFQDQKYFYWEHRTRTNKSIAYVVLGSSGLKLFGTNSRKIGQIMANGADPVRFLSLGRDGNLDLYYYKLSNEETMFRSSYRAINDICNLPLPCGPYQVCSSSIIVDTCSPIQVDGRNHSESCDGRNNVHMVELENVETVLKTSARTNLSEEECVRSCNDAWSCSAATYSKGSCFNYGIVGGAQEVKRGNESTYWVKVSEETNGSCGSSSSLMNKLLLFGEVVDVVAIVLILGGLLYYFLKVRKRSEHSEPEN